MFTRVIFYISLTSFVANATVFSKTSGNFYLCYFQGMLQQFFYPSSWIWTTLLTYLLYSLVVLGRIDITWSTMHAASWLIPVVLTFLPLATDTYGSWGDDDWCSLRPGHMTHNGRSLNEFWRFVTFTAVIFVCFFLMMYYGYLIYRHIYIDKHVPSEKVMFALNLLIYYPISLFITWFPNAVLDACSDANMNEDGPVMVIVNTLSIWQGGCIAIIFFVKSREARHHWKVLGSYLTYEVCGLPLMAFPSSTATGDGPGEPVRESEDIYRMTEDNRSSGVVRQQQQQPTDDRVPSRWERLTSLVNDFDPDEVYRGHHDTGAYRISTAPEPGLRSSTAQLLARWYGGIRPSTVGGTAVRESAVGEIAMVSIPSPSAHGSVEIPRHSSATIVNPIQAHKKTQQLSNQEPHSLTNSSQVQDIEASVQPAGGVPRNEAHHSTSEP